MKVTGDVGSGLPFCEVQLGGVVSMRPAAALP